MSWRVLVSGVITSAEGSVFKIETGSPPMITTVQTATFSVSASMDITDARNRISKIIGTDVLTSNGVIHVIDKVLLPPQ